MSFRAASLPVLVAFLSLSLNWIRAAGPDKSGVKPSAISLPSGAGSIQGLGDSFELQINRGTTEKLESDPIRVRSVFAPGIAAGRKQGFAQRQTLHGVEAKEFGGRAPDGCKGDNARSVHLIVFLPVIVSRMKQSRQLARPRVNRRKVGTFEAIAMEAGPREVFLGCFSPVLAGHSVVDLMRKAAVFLVQTTVFATTSGENAQRLALGRSYPAATHDERCAARTLCASAFSRIMNWSSEAMSSSSAFSSGVRDCSRLRYNSSRERLINDSDGLNRAISSGRGPRPRKPATSRHNPEVLEQRLARPSSMISTRCSLSDPSRCAK